MSGRARMWVFLVGVPLLVVVGIVGLMTWIGTHGPLPFDDALAKTQSSAGTDARIVGITIGPSNVVFETLSRGGTTVEVATYGQVCKQSNTTKRQSNCHRTHSYSQRPATSADNAKATYRLDDLEPGIDDKLFAAASKPQGAGYAQFDGQTWSISTVPLPWKPNRQFPASMQQPPEIVRAGFDGSPIR